LNAYWKYGLFENIPSMRKVVDAARGWKLRCCVCTVSTIANASEETKRRNAFEANRWRKSDMLYANACNCTGPLEGT
jgi:hypothetical protein